MKKPLLTATAAGAAAASAAFLALRHRRDRRRAERLAAAALETLLNAIDANDPVTGAHVRRVAAYSLVLGRALDLPDISLHDIERVALFHDIGKVHEALFDIVHDDDALSVGERALIARHPSAGANVLAPLRAFYPRLSAGVGAHHERWDGSGYPAGLRGEHIPLEARIVAIADTFDAITQRRRYRDAQPASVARRVIAEGRGTQFDPRLVDLFLSPAVGAAVDRVLAAPPERRPSLPDERRHGAVEESVPDVTFRWRPAVPEPPAPGPVSRRSPG